MWRRCLRRRHVLATVDFGLSRAEIRETVRAHLRAIADVLSALNMINSYSPDPANSPAAAYYKGLQDAGWQLHQAGARARGELEEALTTGRFAPAIEALRDLRSLGARASMAAETYGKVFTG